VYYIKTLTHLLPPVSAQAAVLTDRHRKALESRKHVERSGQPNLEGIEDQLNKLRSTLEMQLAVIAEDQQREHMQRIAAQIADLQTAGADAEPHLLIIEDQLQQLPMGDTEANRLRDQVAQVRDAQRAQETLREQMKHELANLTDRTEQVDAAVRPHLEDVKSKSSKKKKQSVQKSIDVDQQIDELKSALAAVNSDILPRLGELQRQADLNNVELDGTSRLQDRLSRLVDEYQVYKI
jgi:archaellum component FlaC